MNGLIPPSFYNMMKWEGATFLLLLFFITTTLIVLYLADLRRVKLIQGFYAALTHELKTPLATLMLQSEVIDALLEEKADIEKVKKYNKRLLEEGQNLEAQFDKILQLSRIEGGGNLNLTEVELLSFFKSIQENWKDKLNIKISTHSNYLPIIADSFALELVFKNFFENTLRYAQTKNSKINIEESETRIVLQYSDDGQFQGDPKKLGTLFYKFNSNKGSGIGLYLSRKLLKAMHIGLEFKSFSPMIHQLTFKKAAA